MSGRRRIQPTRKEPDLYEVMFAPDRAMFRRIDFDIELRTEMVVSPEDCGGAAPRLGHQPQLARPQSGPHELRRGGPRPGWRGPGASGIQQSVRRDDRRSRTRCTHVRQASTRRQRSVVPDSRAERARAPGRRRGARDRPRAFRGPGADARAAGGDVGKGQAVGDHRTSTWIRSSRSDRRSGSPPAGPRDCRSRPPTPTTKRRRGV